LFAILFLFVILTLSVVEGEESPHLPLPVLFVILFLFVILTLSVVEGEGPPHLPLPVSN
jgi:peptidoglycan/LPS O-acetylase OafA/YrhL